MCFSSVCACACVLDNNRRFVWSSFMTEDNIGWQVCVDQTLHRQPPALAFSLYPLRRQSPHPTQPTPPHLHLHLHLTSSSSSSSRELFIFLKITVIAFACIVSMFFCEVRIGLCALSLSTHTVLNYLQMVFMRPWGQQKQRGEGTYRWSMDQPLAY